MGNLIFLVQTCNLFFDDSGNLNNLSNNLLRCSIEKIAQAIICTCCARSCARLLVRSLLVRSIFGDFQDFEIFQKNRFLAILGRSCELRSGGNLIFFVFLPIFKILENCSFMLYGRVYKLCCTGGCINYAARAGVSIMLYGQVYELCCTGGCMNYAVRAIFVFLFGFLSFLSLSREVFVTGTHSKRILAQKATK